ncbi:hypothetical protein C8J56DRAFT_467623 [Mycena floridula]|nr:hypothetical protein C8J56DRAFT_467623 [Mycena floridula]
MRGHLCFVILCASGALALSLSVPEEMILGKFCAITYSRISSDPTDFFVRPRNLDASQTGFLQSTGVNSDGATNGQAFSFQNCPSIPVGSYVMEAFNVDPNNGANNGNFQILATSASYTFADSDVVVTPSTTTSQPTLQTTAKTTIIITTHDETGATISTSSPQDQTHAAGQDSNTISSSSKTASSTGTTGTPKSTSLQLGQTSGSPSQSNPGVPSPSDSIAVVPQTTKSKTGVIVGAAVGALAVLAIVAFCLKRVFLNPRADRKRHGSLSIAPFEQAMVANNVDSRDERQPLATVFPLTSESISHVSEKSGSAAQMSEYQRPIDTDSSASSSHATAYTGIVREPQPRARVHSTTGSTLDSEALANAEREIQRLRKENERFREQEESQALVDMPPPSYLDLGLNRAT